MMKVRIAVESESVQGEQNAEIIWVAGIKITGVDDYIGFLQNSPAYLENLKQGDMVQFNFDQIKGWGYNGEDGKIYGAFTMKAMLSDLSDEKKRITTRY